MGPKEKKGCLLETALMVIRFIFLFLKVVVDAARRNDGTIDHIKLRLLRPELVKQVLGQINRRLLPGELYASELIGVAATGCCSVKNLWKIVWDATPPLPGFKVSNLEAVAFVDNKNNNRNRNMSVELLREHALNLGATIGLCHLKVVLENQENIPVKLREFCLVFAGTILCNVDNNNYVPCLHFDLDDQQWHLLWRMIECVDIFNGQIRLAYSNYALEFET